VLGEGLEHKTQRGSEIQDDLIYTWGGQERKNPLSESNEIPEGRGGRAGDRKRKCPRIRQQSKEREHSPSGCQDRRTGSEVDPRVVGGSNTKRVPKGGEEKGVTLARASPLACGDWKGEECEKGGEV